MIVEEAIEYFCNRYIVVGSSLNPPEEICRKHNTAVGMAICALEKRNPKKVISDGKGKYYCPSCGKSALTDTGDSFVDYRLSYCDNCGQRLEWDE